ncbi:AzlD domain-containing protein [Paenibacillus antarcticus]|uniref:Branched-chain amino acid transporter AzlD n=1 Tax=Paenibacillus antarcticus TaxID=253703 RepID=A0A168MXY8_9BACL|nr:AzlD domain-containing protein [Paenibacillus antarcticus]OAB45174.1 hypothetical protein PBAT_14655 [Paenibacillus antarcticus]
MTLLLILGMGIITFLFRFTPLLIRKKSEPRQKESRLLDNLPLAVLSALIIPGIFQVDAETPRVGFVAGIVAVVMLLVKKVPLYGVIVISVLAAVIVKLIYLF